MNIATETAELRRRYLIRSAGQEHFIQGDEAAAMGAIYAGCNFFGGYPITPASEVAETMARELPLTGGYYVQFEDELASISAVIGATWAGARAMTATSGPGFSLMQENIGYACMTETPCVIIDVQRSGPSTGQATLPAQGDVMQARWGTHGDHAIIALAPSSAQECADLMIDCFNLAETYRTPVIFLMDGEIGHLRERVVLPHPDRVAITARRKAAPGEPVFGGQLIPPMLEFGEGGFVHVTGSTHKDNGMRDVQTPEVHDRLVRRLVALQARAAGHRVTFVRPVTIWPFPSTQIRAGCAGARRVIVPEMNLGQLVREVERHVDGEVIPLSKIGGETHTSQEIRTEIERALP